MMTVRGTNETLKRRAALARTPIVLALGLVALCLDGAGALAQSFPERPVRIIVPLATSLPLIAAGKLRALAVTGARRPASLPDVPTVAESGVPGFASSSWQGFFVAARTPRDIVDLIQRKTAKVLQAPDMRERLAALAYEPVDSTPQDFDAYFKSELARFAGVVKQAHIPPQD